VSAVGWTNGSNPIPIIVRAIASWKRRGSSGFCADGIPQRRNFSNRNQTADVCCRRFSHCQKIRSRGVPSGTDAAARTGRETPGGARRRGVNDESEVYTSGNTARKKKLRRRGWRRKRASSRGYRGTSQNAELASLREQASQTR